MQLHLILKDTWKSVQHLTVYTHSTKESVGQALEKSKGVNK